MDFMSHLYEQRFFRYCICTHTHMCTYTQLRMLLCGYIFVTPNHTRVFHCIFITLQNLWLTQCVIVFFYQLIILGVTHPLCHGSFDHCQGKYRFHWVLDAELCCVHFNSCLALIWTDTFNVSWFLCHWTLLEQTKNQIKIPVLSLCCSLNVSRFLCHWMFLEQTKNQIKIPVLR